MTEREIHLLSEAKQIARDNRDLESIMEVIKEAKTVCAALGIDAPDMQALATAATSEMMAGGNRLREISGVMRAISEATKEADAKAAN